MPNNIMIPKNKSMLLLLICLLFICLTTASGCAGKSSGPSAQDAQQASAAKFPITVTDDLGRQVTLKAVPQRIVSVAPSQTEILFALGLGDQVVGVTTYCNYPKEALSRKKIGGFTSPSLEKIVALQPDLVLVTTDKQQNLIPSLENANITVLAFSPKSIADTLKTIGIIGQATGANDAAARLNASLQKRIDAVQAKVKTIPQEKRLRVYYELWYEPLMSAGPATLASDLIEKAGGKSITADAREDYAEISEEMVISSDPQVMLNTYAHGQSLPDIGQITQRPGWTGLSFVKDKRIYSLNADLIDRAGPRVAEALELVAQTLYPDLFTGEADGKSVKVRP